LLTRFVAPVATLELRSGATHDVLIDGRMLLPSTLTGTVRIDGRPLANAALSIAWRRCVGSATSGAEYNTTVPTDAHCAFTTVLDPPACYRLTLPLRTKTFSGWVRLLDWFPAPVGGTIHHDFDLRTGTVRLRVVAADGTTPMTQRRIYFWHDRGERCGTGTTDDDGWIEVLMPSTRLEPRVHRMAREEANSYEDHEASAWRLEPFTILAGTATEVIRKLPAK
jgi:hypothetical protein